MHCYWAARGLAERGHQVFVVTNAEEVEDTFRIQIPERDRAADGMYAPSFPNTGGRVSVCSTTPPDRRSLYYIPMGNPTVSRLASRATDIIREHNCTITFSYYLEPYGMAAYLASKWTNTPYIFKHAGSDLHRLMPISDLTSGYREVLRSANRVLSAGLSRRVVSSHGIPEERIEGKVGFGLPRAFFNAKVEPMDIDALLQEHLLQLEDDHPHRAYLRPLDPKLPTLGIYGKMGEYKGTFDLLHAIGRLARSGFPLQLVALSRGWQEEVFYEIGEELGLQEFLRTHPFIPHWRIPSFIRACDAVAFLERDFPIAAHTPTIPSEILSCGRCLLISEEVLRKQMYRSKVRDRCNVIVVSDPCDHDELADALRFALSDTARAEAIGRAGTVLIEDQPGYLKYIDELEKVLTVAAKESPVVPAAREEPDDLLGPRRQDPLQMIGQTYPYVDGVLDDEQRHRLQLTFQGSGFGAGINDRKELVQALGQRLYEMLADDSGCSLLGDICRYEYKLHQWAKYNDNDDKPERKLRGKFPPDLDAMRPVLEGEWEIQEFAFDVEKVAERISTGEMVPAGSFPDFACAAPMYVLFHKGSVPMRIGPAIAATLVLLETERLTTRQLMARLTEVLGRGSKECLDPAITSVLEGLFWEGVLQFEPHA